MCRREVNLTEEEKETLKAEGLPIPTTLPLTKVAVHYTMIRLHYDQGGGGGGGGGLQL